MRVLVVDDATRWSGVTVRELRALGVRAELEHDAVVGLRRAVRGRYEVVVLDLAGSGLDPVTACERLGAPTLPVPILVLSANGDARAEVAALDAGAADFVRKPVPVAVLAARLRALARRGAPAPHPAVLRCGSLVLDVATRRVHRRGVPVDLTRREFELLEILVTARGAVVSKIELLERLWGDDARPNSVEVYVHYLRNKVDVPFGVQTVQTVHGIGYRVVPGR